MRLFIVVLVVLGLSSHAASACGPDSDCRIGDRIYRIAMPEGPPKGALIHSHGYRGTAKGVIRNKGLRALASEIGYALVAPKSAGDDWKIPGTPSDPGIDGSGEFSYFDALLDRLTGEHGIPADQIYASGFSAGGMMVWNLACQRGSDFAGFIPIAGTFWEPMPQSCPNLGARMVHVHGLSDRIVPLGGRPIGPTHQGDVPTALTLFSQGTETDTPTARLQDLNCQEYDLGTERSLSFCTHLGGHSIKAAYLRAGLDIIHAHASKPE